MRRKMTAALIALAISLTAFIGVYSYNRGTNSAKAQNEYDGFWGTYHYYQRTRTTALVCYSVANPGDVEPETAYAAYTTIMRAGMGYGCDKITVIPKGAQIAVYEESRGFRFVEYNGMKGYIPADDIAATAPLSDREITVEPSSSKIHYTDSYFSYIINHMYPLDDDFPYQFVLDEEKERFKINYGDYIYYETYQGKFEANTRMYYYPREELTDWKPIVEHTQLYKDADIFFFDYGPSAYVNENTILLYATLSERRYEQLKALDEALDTIVREITNEDMTEREAVKAIFDYVCDNFDYPDDEDEYLRGLDFNLRTGTAVCEGYSMLFFELATRCGIQAEYIEGEANGGGHAWNSVVIDGNTYYLDATWADNKGIKDAYFLVDDQDISGSQRTVLARLKW